MVDVGIFPGNYFDYDDDETARQRTKEIARVIPKGASWDDPSFPTDSRALFFDPLNPPKVRSED